MTAVLASVTTAGLVGAGLFIGAGTSAAATLDLNYTCTFPLIDQQPVNVKINADIPDTITAGVPTGEFNIEALATLNEDTTTGLKLVKVATIEGSTMATAHITAPGFDTDLDVPITVEKTAVPASGGFTVRAFGKTPSLKFNQAGPIKITVGDLLMTITARKADGSLASLPPSNPFDAPCPQDPGQNNVLKEGQILPGGGGTTTPTTPTSTTNPTTTTTPPVTTSTTKPTVTTTPGGGGTVKYGYNLAGKSNLKNMSGDVPLKGTIDATLTLSTQKFVADLVLNPATANLSIMGFLPVVSKVEFVNERQTTGSIEADGTLKSNSLLTIKLPQVSLFGFPISQSADCKTVTPSEIPLATPPGFDIIAGGQMTGTYTIAPLKGCGSFNDYISGFAASAGNTIAINLVPR